MTTETRRPEQETRVIGRSWQDAVEGLASGYGDQLRRFAELTSGFYSLRWLDREDVRETVRRIVEGTREVTAAQVGVAGEWLRAPFWITGAASPADLQARYVRLVEAQRDLAHTYLDAALGFQRALTGAAEQATDTAKDAVDANVRTARRVANHARRAQQAATNGARDVVTAAREAAVHVADKAQETVEAAALTLRPIKGNVNSRGEKIYHLPGQATYERTQAEETFATEEEAQAAGYRRSEARGGGTIKGHINREGERIYHTPGQANYDRIDADMLFETEEQAQAAGFRAAQR